MGRQPPHVWRAAVIGLLCATALQGQAAGDTAFTYQGQLKQAGVPVDGTANFTFELWDAEIGGAMLDRQGLTSVEVIDGLFTVPLDFGSTAFNGDARWLEVEVEFPTGIGNWTPLTPRQPLTATPYALYALSGPGSDGNWAVSGNDIYSTNTGGVGIGTTSPSHPLHVEGDDTGGIIYARNNAASGRALFATSNGTAVYASGGSCGLDAYTASPGGNAISAFNEAESGNAHAVYGENISPNGIAIYGRTSNGNDYAGGIGVYGVADNDGYYSAGIGVYGRSASDHGGAGVYGEATATGGESAYGVHGVSTSSAGVRGEQTDTGNYGILGSDQYGVVGRGGSAGGHFEDADGTSSVDVAWGYFGINAEGSLGGGAFSDSDGSANADIAHGDRGLRAGGAEYGGKFHDTDSSGQAYIGYGDRGIEAEGSEAGGYFEDTDGTGYAYVGYGNRGIEAEGSEVGGYFEDTDGSGYAHVGYGDRGIEARGSAVGGYFEDTNDSGHAYIGYGDVGIDANGNEAGGRFEETVGGSITFVADRLTGTGISAYGPNAGGYFADQDGSGYAYVASGHRGIEAEGREAGGYFEDSDGSGYAYVGYGNRGIEATGTEAGGYFEDSDGSGYAYVGYVDRGIHGYGNRSGGYFEDLTSGNWSSVAWDTTKIIGTGSCDFMQNHPEDPGAVIVYASPEGDEVATYTRGTGRLQNGVARVPLGETFKWVTNPDIGLTAHLTPRGNCDGLYVEVLGTNELIVRELRGGTSNVTFDYIVYGLRIGFEEVSIVQDKEREAYIPSMADQRALYERRPELRDYNALERFKRMRAAAGQTEPLDLSTSHALRDAIVEFDLEIHRIEHRDGPQAETIAGAEADAARRPAPPGHAGAADASERSPRKSPSQIISHRDTEIDTLRAESAARQQRIEVLETRLARLESLVSTPGGSRNQQEAVRQ